MLIKRATALAVVCLLAAVPVYGQQSAGSQTSGQSEDTPPSRPISKRFDIQFSLGAAYDTNAARFRDDTIDEFESGEFAIGRFRESSISDVNWVPRVQLRYSLTPSTRRTTRIYGSFGTSQYVENGVRSYERFYVGFDQYLTDARPDLRMVEAERAAYAEIREASGGTRERLSPGVIRARRSFLLSNTTRFGVRYSRSPNRFVGQLIDRDDGGRRAGIYDYDSFQIGWEQRLNSGRTNRLRLDLTYRRDKYDYVQEFEERDSSTDRFFIGLHYFRNEFPDNAFWELGVDFERARRESNTALLGRVGAAGPIVDDLGYDANVVYLTVARTWYRDPGGIDLTKNNRIRFRARYGDKDFTSDNPLDRSHFLRSDRFWRFQADYRHPVRNWVALDGGVEYARVSGAFEPRAGVDDPSDFHNVRILLGATFYVTGWRSTR